MSQVWMLRGLAGGALIGVSASLMLVLAGRVTGISGMLNAVMAPADGGERLWRVLFLGGLVAGGLVASMFVPGAFADEMPGLALAGAAGVLVGVGTRIGNGCTSGHGVCGISRLSVRSLVATVTFIGTGALAVLALRVLGGGS
jgi:uncharacterized membrane protein YedE/YeeE